MKRFFSNKNSIAIVLFASMILFAFNGSHPTSTSGGYTGAPGDNVCTTCHSPGGDIDGNVMITGLPETVFPNTTYPLTISVTATNGNAAKAGFQMVSLKNNLANGGTFDVPGGETNLSVKTIAGKSYIGHQPAKSLSGNNATYTINWTAPSTANGEITLYTGAILANGANGNSNDKFIATSISTTLDQGEPLTATFSNIVNTTCHNINDGSATINAMGGSGNYSYAWDNGESTATAIMLEGGDHTVTITDDSNNSIEEAVTINSPNPISINIISQSDATCFGDDDGTCEIVAEGGNSNYSYTWSNGNEGAIQNSLPAGSYTVTVIDENDCNSFATIEIGQPENLAINVLEVINPSCFGSSDGSILVNVSGGDGNYTYSWLTNGIGNSTADTLITDLPGGTFSLEVFDGAGCNTALGITLSQPSPLTVVINPTNVTCKGGSDGQASTFSLGGTGDLSFAWSTGASGPTATGLSAGDYSVTATDENSCTTESVFSIGEPETAVDAYLEVATQSTCGNSDGKIIVSGTGGSPGYTFLWEDGSTNDTLSNVPSGTYTVIITDQVGCVDTSMIVLEDNDGITLAANNVSNNVCYGDSSGTATISASGGDNNYTFAWSNGGTMATESGLPAGSYTITVTDGNNCTGDITIEISQPEQIFANATVSNISCHGMIDGSIILEPSGGTGPWTIMWADTINIDTLTNLDNGQYSVTISDINNCVDSFLFNIIEPDSIAIDSFLLEDVSCYGLKDGQIYVDAVGGTGILNYQWSTEDTLSSIDSLDVGMYALSISDTSNCSITQSFIIEQPEELVLDTFTVQSPSCFGLTDGSLSVEASGGSGILSYTWSTGDSTKTLSNIGAGMYGLTITDDNSCAKTFEYTLTEPSPIMTDSLYLGTPSCFGENDGILYVSATGGTAPLSYLWNSGHTTQIVDSLNTGHYNVAITDANGCKDSINFSLDQPLEIGINTNIQSPLCAESNDGSIIPEITGGTGPYDIIWNDSIQTDTLNYIASGVYSIQITDTNGCMSTSQVTVSSPDQIIASLDVMNESMSGTNDGSISVTTNGGTGDLSYLWSNNEVSPTIDNLMPGIYYLTITDANQCTYIDSAIVNSGECAIEASATVQDLSCNQSFDGVVVLEVENATKPINYLWNTGSTSSGLTNIAAGTYSVVIMDANDCTFSLDSIVVNEPTAIVALDTTIVDATAPNFDNGSIQLTLSGGAGNYSSGLILDDDIILDKELGDSIMIGTYTVFVMDEDECFSYFGPFEVGMSVSVWEEDNSLKIYPNPTKSLLTIELGKTMVSDVEILNIDGKRMNVPTQKGMQRILLDTRSLNSGIYMLRIQQGRHTITKKIVVQR